MTAIIYDLDQTLVDSRCAAEARRSRSWSAVNRLIGQFSLYAGVPELLDQHRDIPSAIVTSSPDQYASRVLAALGIDIKIIVGYHHTDRRKPYPDPLLLAMRRLRDEAGWLGQPEQLIAVGDQARDIRAAKAAGTYAVAAAWDSDEPDSLLAAEPDAVCESATELAALIQARL